MIRCYPVVGGFALFPQWGITKTYENKMSNDALEMPGDGKTSSLGIHRTIKGILLLVSFGGYWFRFWFRFCFRIPGVPYAPMGDPRN